MSNDQGSGNWSHADPNGADEEPAFVPGTRLRAAGAVYQILPGSSEQQLKIQNLLSGDVRVTTAAQLLIAINEGAVTALPDDFAVPGVHQQYQSPDQQEQWIEEVPATLHSSAAVQVMVKKHEWLQRLKQHGVTNFRPSSQLQMHLREVERDCQAKCEYTLETLYKSHLQLKKAGGKATALLPKFKRRGGAGQSRLQPEVDAIMETVFTNLEKPGSHKLNASSAREEIKHAIEQANNGRRTQTQLVLPSLPTVMRRFHSHFDAYALAERNYGKARAKQLFRNMGARVQAQRCLDVTMFDDTDSCVFLKDDRTGLPWGRAWITFGVDEKSRSVTGMSMSHAHRSMVSAIEAVMHSLQPKDESHGDFSLCQNKWYAYGNPGLIVLDNASYNTSHDFQSVLLDLGIEYEFARPHQPTNKTCVEYFHHRMKDEFCRNLPGWSGPKEDREMLDEGIASAVLDLSYFRRSLTRWIVDEYSNIPQRGGLSPRMIWDEDFAFHAPFMPERMPSHELLGTAITYLTFRDSGGLLRNRLRYNSEALDVLRKRHGKRVQMKVRYRHDNLNFIYVEDPTNGAYLAVPCIEDPSLYQGLTDYQWKLILKRARALFDKNIGGAEVIEAREKLRQETRALSTSKNMRERRRSQTFRDIDSDSPATRPNVNDRFKPEPAPPLVAVSELETMVASVEEDYPDDSSEMQAVFLGEPL